jgi:hypothetical protein
MTKKITTPIRFYDNQMDIIRQFNSTLRYVDAFLVPNTPNREILKGSKNSYNYTSEFLKIHPENKFAQHLYSLKNKENGTCIGFSEKDAIELTNWANKLIQHNKAAIFDWDGTLSVIEGVVLPTTETETKMYQHNNISFHEIAHYYCGTKYRFYWLRSMFEYLHNRNVEIFILTNNPIASTKRINGLGKESKNNFFRVAKEIIPCLKKENILCGYETNGFKPYTFLKNKYLYNLYSSILL